VASLALQRGAQQKYVDPWDFASLYVQLGDHSQAMVCLERAYQERSPRLPMLNVQEEFAPLHSDVRFKDLVRRIGFSQ
jgi:hypothetical protein